MSKTATQAHTMNVDNPARLVIISSFEFVSDLASSKKYCNTVYHNYFSIWTPGHFDIDYCDTMQCVHKTQTNNGNLDNVHTHRMQKIPQIYCAVGIVNSGNNQLFGLVWCGPSVPLLTHS